jgi:hypothetical protein
VLSGACSYCDTGRVTVLFTGAALNAAPDPCTSIRTAPSSPLLFSSLFRQSLESPLLQTPVSNGRKSQQGRDESGHSPVSTDERVSRGAGRAGRPERRCGFALLPRPRVPSFVIIDVMSHGTPPEAPQDDFEPQRMPMSKERARWYEDRILALTREWVIEKPGGAPVTAVRITGTRPDTVVVITHIRADGSEQDSTWRVWWGGL